MIGKLVNALDVRVADIAAAAMIIMVMAVTMDVFLRYTFNSPLSWSYDLISMYLLPAVVFLPLALVQRRSHHINVDLLYRRFHPITQKIASAISLIGSGAILGTIGVLSLERAWASLINNEVIAGPIPWPVWIGPALLSLGAGLYVVRVIVGLINVVQGKGQQPSAGPSDGPASMGVD